MPNSITRSLSGVGREFMQGMGYGALPPSDQVPGRPSPPLELPYMKAKTIVPLPAPESITLPALALRDAIEQRESIRTYALEPLTLPEVAYILWCTRWVRRAVDVTFTIRTVPSAGARHAIGAFGDAAMNRLLGSTAKSSSRPAWRW